MTNALRKDMPPPDDGGTTRLQRVEGCGRIAVRDRQGRTCLDRLFQEGAAKIRIPRAADRGFEAVLINTAGGLTGGDRLSWEIEAGPRTALTVTTQACEKTYRAGQGTIAEVSVRLSVGGKARLAWLPQETILFDRSALTRCVDADIGPGGRLLLVEPVLFGRLAMGERVREAMFRDRWRIRSEGELVHAEDFRIGPAVAAGLAENAVAGGASAMATLLLVGSDAADRLDRARALIGPAGGASAWAARPDGTGKLLARILAEDGYRLRKILVPLIRLLNEETAVPKIWSM